MKVEPPETPVLTKQQQKNTVSAKKKPQGRILFASPFDTYWPELNEEAEEEFNELLLSTLKPVAKPAVKVNWSVLRKLPREQRKEVRSKMQMESCNGSPPGQADELRKCLYLGVNAVTRGLGSSGVSAVLLAKDADPKLLISHILTMCSIQRIPVLVVPALRVISRTALGFSCLALAIKKDAMDNFQSLCKAVAVHSAKIPVPEPLPSYQNALAQKSDHEEVKEPPESQCKEISISTDVYKYRSSKKERVFMPSNATPVTTPSGDFLGLDVHMEEESSISGFRYKRLKLKQLHTNPYKIRKKELNKKRRKKKVVL